MKKALISSISTPKPMESKSIILRLFGTLPVLLRQNSQKSWWQIFPVKKPLAWLCLIIIIVWWGWKQMSTETRLGYFKIQHTQGNLPLAYLWQPHGGALLGKIKSEWEQGNQGNHEKDFFPGISDKKSAVSEEKKFVMWTNMAMWSTINSSKPAKELQVGFAWCVNSCKTNSKPQWDNLRNVNIHFVFQNRLPDPTVCWLLHHVRFNNQ